MGRKRYILDGTVGGGKTTLLSGVSTVDARKQRYPSLSDFGFDIRGGVIRKTISELHLKGKAPFSHLEDFFAIALELEIKEFESAKQGEITFYDRGLPFQKILAENHNYKLPFDYNNYFEIFRYDSPVFIIDPITSFDMSKPLLGEEPEKIFPLEKRLIHHQKVIELYSQLGYDILIVPVLSDDILENISLRLKFILNAIKK